MQDDDTDAPDSAGNSGGTNKATLRTLNVLSAYVSRSAPYGVTELSNDLGMTKNMAFRALTTLLEHGYTVRDAGGSRYELGHGALWLQGAGADEELDIRAVCAPFLQRYHEATAESAFLSVIVGRNHVTIDSVEAHGVRVSHSRRGLLVPLHASPASRVLLSVLSDEEIAEYIRAASPLKRFTPTTITRPEKLWEEVRKVRKQGFARGYGDHYAHANYISFPVLDVTGRPHAAITIGGPPDRLSKQRIEMLLPELMRITKALNDQTRLYPSSATVLFG
jgi:IclR family acetate operon transcriptional repressor